MPRNLRSLTRIAAIALMLLPLLVQCAMAIAMDDRVDPDGALSALATGDCEFCPPPS